ncbi:conserved hypothetical protein, partial [Ricinus communis]
PRRAGARYTPRIGRRGGARRRVARRRVHVHGTCHLQGVPRTRGHSADHLHLDRTVCARKRSTKLATRARRSVVIGGQATRDNMASRPQVRSVQRHLHRSLGSKTERRSDYLPLQAATVHTRDETIRRRSAPSASAPCLSKAGRLHARRPRRRAPRAPSGRVVWRPVSKAIETGLNSASNGRRSCALPRSAIETGFKPVSIERNEKN